MLFAFTLLLGALNSAIATPLTVPTVDKRAAVSTCVYHRQTRTLVHSDVFTAVQQLTTISYFTSNVRLPVTLPCWPLSCRIPQTHPPRTLPPAAPIRTEIRSFRRSTMPLPTHRGSSRATIRARKVLLRYAEGGFLFQCLDSDTPNWIRLAHPRRTSSPTRKFSSRRSFPRALILLVGRHVSCA
jgi:hypothetical protein